ncbi:electron transport complex, RnfABCDGE type, C subunit [Thioflavicoccus mobilis 8321]|uniref:Ion-translocating oxidoreductase complex subunit C n=1 Tax=Thioflavicoccus mobilis 8321 TaxID=765912 RepID=L0GSP3_9GAMM|nr:electron transport complex subunit RsxC [Thioflavicoccus mobilis]AGA89788.1 electron transport complex, RnfABCDGE type, C subunit [Thioflavicoccus mobilis 8321]
MSPVSLLHYRRSKRRLWRFHGGIHVPDEKALSNERPVVAAPLPRQLILPLQQHIGAMARPCVAVGDRVLRGQVIAEPSGYVSAPIHASSSGTVVAIEERPVPHPSGLVGRCIVIETDGQDAAVAPLPPLMDYRHVDPALVLERIRACGIVGLGGASFPTSVKLNPGPDHPIDTLIINAAECEPYITCDDLLMRTRAEDVIEGVRIIQHLLDAKECLIGVEDNKPEAIAALRTALAESDLTATEVVAIPTLYPSGGERQLIRILTGKEVPTSGIPAMIGVVCQNVSTTAAVAEAVLEGRPLVSRLVTVTGRAIAEPRNLEVRIGTPAADLIAHCGGYADEVRKLVCGGPMMGFTLQTDEAPVTKATNCLLALTPAESPDPGSALSCIRCGRCAEVCPTNLLPQQMYWHARAKDLDKVQDYNLFDCIECGCCAHVCPSHIPLVQYYRFAKASSWAREKEKRQAEHARLRHAAKQERVEREKREKQAKLREKAAAVKGGKAAQGGDAPAKQAAIAAARERAAAKRAVASRVRDAEDSAPDAAQVPPHETAPKSGAGAPTVTQD